MKNNQDLKTDPNKRSEYKKLQREKDLFNLKNKKISRTTLQKRNSIFTGIDWSQIEIYEPDGYTWKILK